MYIVWQKERKRNRACATEAGIYLVGRSKWGRVFWSWATAWQLRQKSCGLLHVDWQTLFILSHTQAQPLKCRLDRQSWNICSFPSRCSSRQRQGCVSGQAGSGWALVPLRPAALGAGRKVRGWRRRGFTADRGGCDPCGLNSNVGTEITHCVWKRQEAWDEVLNSVSAELAQEAVGFMGHV